MGYLVMGVFLLITGLFLWVFPDTSILNYGAASLESFFFLAPLIFTFLIPAITMRSFAEEFNTGTIEWLSTRPVTDWQVILGKYFACVFLVLFSILPTLLYFYSVYQLGAPIGNIDTGATWGSYIGLGLLGSAFAAIGIFCSALSNNQIVAFLLAVFLCFFSYSAFDYLSRMNIFFAKFDYILEQIGMNAHYLFLSRGAIDSRDILYFITFIIIFLLLTKMVIEIRKGG